MLHQRARRGSFGILALIACVVVPCARELSLHPGDTSLSRSDAVVVDLDEATVHAAPRASSAHKGVTLEGAALERGLGRTLGDALTALEGVSLLRSGPTIAKPEIRGLQGNRIQILNNGVRLEGQQWGSEHAPEVDPFLAGSMTVIKGAAGVRYGPEALGGVVLVTPRPLRRSPGHDGEWHALATTAGRGGATALRYDVVPASAPRLALRVQGTLRRLGDQEAPRYVLSNTGVSERNMSAAAGYGAEDWHAEVYYSRFHTELGILRAAHIGNLTDLEEALARDEPAETGPFSYAIDRPRQVVIHDLVKLQGGRHWGAGHLELSWSFQNNDRSEYDKHRPLDDSLAALDRPELRFTIYTHQAEAVFERTARDGFSGEYGLAGTVQGNASLGRAFVPNFMNYGGGIFALERWSGDRWGAEAGLRYDYRLLRTYRNIRGEIVQSDFGNGGVSAALGGLRRMGENSEARLNLSSAWRPPSASELYSNGLHHGAAAVEYGDTALGREIAYNAAITYERSGVFLRELEAEGFVTYIRNYIGLLPDTPATLTIRGAFPTFRYHAADALLHGAEARAVVALLPWIDYGVRGSLLWAREIASGTGLLFTPAHRGENSLTVHAARWRGLADLSATIRAQAVLRQGNPAPNDYAPPPRGYALLHAEAGFTWLSAAGPLDVELQARNLLNASYRDYTNRFRYYADEPGREIALRLKLAFGS